MRRRRLRPFLGSLPPKQITCPPRPVTPSSPPLAPGRVIGGRVDWPLGRLMASGFDQVQVHVDHLIRSTDAASDLTWIILETALWGGSWDGVPDLLVANHDPEFTGALFKAFRSSCAASALASSSARPTTTTPTRSTGCWAAHCSGWPLPTAASHTQGRLRHSAALHCLGHQQRGLDAGRRADPILHLQLTASAHAAVPPRLACRCLSQPAAGESPAVYATRMKALD